MKPRQQELLRARDHTDTHDIVISRCAKGVWTVVYQGQPFQIRRDHVLGNEKKYIPNSWSQRGGAERQARLLNQLFHTTDFEIAEILGKTPD
jgi:hypothetical protein